MKLRDVSPAACRSPPEAGRAARHAERGEPFTRAAMQKSADGQRVEQVVALRGERTGNAGQHVAAAALGQRRAAETVMRTRPSGAAMTVRLPFSSRKQPCSAANARAVRTRLRLIPPRRSRSDAKAPSGAA